jgi:hypothetical protein
MGGGLVLRLSYSRSGKAKMDILIEGVTEMGLNDKVGIASATPEKLVDLIRESKRVYQDLSGSNQRRDLQESNQFRMMNLPGPTEKRPTKGALYAWRRIILGSDRSNAKCGE